MALKFTQKFVEEAPAPTDGRGQIIHYDTEVTGLGVRVTKAGARSFVLNYRTRTGLERRLTIGAVKDWPLKLAREEARRLRRIVDQGGDPLAEREARRVAPTVANLIERWREDAAPKKRPRSRREDEGLIRQWILPVLGTKKVAEVKRSDIEKLHQKISKTGTAVRANRVVALLSRLLNLAIGWEMRADNAASKIERNAEEARHRSLSGDELERLVTTLAAQRNQQAANIVLVLILTGARRGEVLAMRWDQLELQEPASWTKPASATKQARLHRVPLNSEARGLLVDLKLAASSKAAKTGRALPPYVFAARTPAGHITDIKHAWARLCREARISDLHLHDLRHTFASVLASDGYSLPLIGALLGHSQSSTTQRYAHLTDQAQRQAAERLGGLIKIGPGKTGEVLPLRPARK